VQIDVDLHTIYEQSCKALLLNTLALQAIFLVPRVIYNAVRFDFKNSCGDEAVHNIETQKQQDQEARKLQWKV